MSYAAWFPKLAAIGALALLSAGSVTSAEAQFGRRLKDAVKRTAEDKAIQKATEEESKAIDTALSGGGEPARPPSPRLPRVRVPPPRLRLEKQTLHRERPHQQKRRARRLLSSPVRVLG
jgi:hypothetical protein